MNPKFIKFLWKIAIIKILIAMIIGGVMMANANAFRFEAFGWQVKWQEQPQIIDETDEPYFEQTNNFDEEIAIANSYKETQLFLKELDYERIGIIDTSTNEQYTIIISNEGIIERVEIGLNEPETIIRADMPMARKRVVENNFIGLRNYVKIPFKVKLKIILMIWF